MRKQTIIILLLATGLAWAEALQGQTNGAQRVADDGSLIPARVLLENPSNPLADLHTDVARLLTDTRYAEFLASPQDAPDAQSIVAALRSYMKDYPDAPHRNRLRAMLAEAYYACGDYCAMDEQMKDIDIEALPDDELERLVVTYGMALTGLGRLDDARVQLLTAQLMGGRYKDEATFGIAWVDYANRQYDEAVKGFNAVEEIPAFRPSALFYKAEAALEKGDYATALVRADSALAAFSPTDTKARLPHNLTNESLLTEAKRVRGEALFGVRRYDESALQLEDYLALADEPNREALFRLGLAHYNSGEYLRAPEVLALIDKAGNDDDAVAQCAELYSGLSYLKTGDATRARMSFERASAMTADEHLREQAMYNHIAALHETGGGAFGEGVTVAERFLNEFPASPWAQNVNTYLVETYLSTRNYVAALQSIEKINHPSETILEARQKLLCRAGQESFASGEMDKAIDFFSEAINMGTYDRPTRAEALLWRGEARYRQGNYAQARADYANCLSQSPDARTALLARYGQAYCYFRQGNYNEAYRQFDQFFSTSGVSSYT
ncbi:MAG: tetratricopeptide repeat protein, partial [Bacteroidaceae bacterium]|nr:tetratricopeptide repeat protein [Bacteroidaceae bacterium]